MQSASRRPILSAVATAAVLMLSGPLPAAAQGHSGFGHSHQGGVTAGSGTSSTPLPASGSGIRNFGVWLDDASVAEPGGGWMSVSFGYYKTDLFKEVDVPVADAGVGIMHGVQFGFSVPVYNLNEPGGTATHGLGDVYLHSKIQLRDAADAPHGVGYAILPIIEVLSSVPAEGQHRVNWALPVSVELQRSAWRAYGSAGYFSRGSLFASGALERTLTDRLWITGTLSHAYSTKADVVPVAGLNRVRTDVSGGASYAIRPSWIVFGSVGRTISTHDENSARISVSGGISLNLAAPAEMRHNRAQRR